MSVEQHPVRMTPRAHVSEPNLVREDRAEPAVQRSVSFSKIEIRTYEVVLGDNPSCSNGPPIQLGWRHSQTRSLSLDMYEKHRPEFRREKSELALPYFERRLMLKRSGHSEEEINKATKEVKQIQQKRLQHINPKMSFFSLTRKILELRPGFVPKQKIVSASSWNRPSFVSKRKTITSPAC